MEQLAADLAAAFLAHRFGVSPTEAYQKYVLPNLPTLRDYWTKLAEQVCEENGAHIGKQLQPLGV